MNFEKTLEVKELNVAYLSTSGSTHVLRNLTMELAKGKITGIAGESGSGKSTLASSIQNIFLPPAYLESGEIIFEGTDLLAAEDSFLLSIRGTKISYMPQAAMNSLNPTRKIIEIFNDIMVSHDININEHMEDIYESMDLAGIARDALWMYPHQLSGGMKQRVVLAISTFLKPDLLILDEPTTGLDVIVQAEILKSIKEVQKARGLTMILITHDISILYEVSDYVMVLYGGKIVEFGEYSRLLYKPSHPYTFMLVASVPSIRNKTAHLKIIPGEPISFNNYPKGCNFAPRCPFKKDICEESEPEKVMLDQNNYYYCKRYPEWTKEEKDYVR
ncbi:MAG: ABC transporter ATP-binding protein [Thermoplasmatales archaeon]